LDLAVFFSGECCEVDLPPVDTGPPRFTLIAPLEPEPFPERGSGEGASSFSIEVSPLSTELTDSAELLVVLSSPK